MQNLGVLGIIMQKLWGNISMEGKSLFLRTKPPLSIFLQDDTSTFHQVMGKEKLGTFGTYLWDF